MRRYAALISKQQLEQQLEEKTRDADQGASFVVTFVDLNYPWLWANFGHQWLTFDVKWLIFGDYLATTQVKIVEDQLNHLRCSFATFRHHFVIISSSSRHYFVILSSNSLWILLEF